MRCLVVWLENRHSGTRLWLWLFGYGTKEIEQGGKIPRLLSTGSAKTSIVGLQDPGLGLNISFEIL